MTRLVSRVALAATALLALAACGSDSNGSDLTVTPSTSAAAADAPSPTTAASGADSTAAGPATTAAATETTGGTATTVADTAGAAGSASGGDGVAEMQAALSTLVDTSVAPADLAAGIDGGADLGPTFEQLQTYIEGFDVDLELVDPVITGDTASASVRIVSNGTAFDQLYPTFFAQVDGHWQVTRAGACALLAVTTIVCPE